MPIRPCPCGTVLAGNTARFRGFWQETMPAGGCTCRQHTRTPAHNARIGMSVSSTAQAKIAAGIPHLTREADTR